ncbi:MAG TPA: MFS transporter [Steroidobacteraceae bacterium]
MRALLTMAAYSIVGNTVLAVQPIVVGAMVDLLHFSQRQAGFIAAAELSGFSLGGACLLTFVHRANRRVIAISGVALVCVADVLACLIKSFPLMLVDRSLAGVGSAVAYAIFPVLAAASAKPERVFGIINATSIAYAGVFVWIGPTLIAKWGLPGIYLVMVALAVLVSPSIFWTPAYGPKSRTALAAGAAHLRGWLAANANVLILLVVLVCLYVGHGGIWAYQERIGVAAGIPRAQVGRLLGSSMLIWGVAGSLLSSWVGLSIGRIWPQIISFGGSIMAAMLLVAGTGPVAYGIACALIAASWFFGLPYLTGLLALFDPKGRANIAGMLASTTGSALGPAVAAILIGYGSGYPAIGAMAGVCYLLCLVLVLSCLSQLRAAASKTVEARR